MELYSAFSYSFLWEIRVYNNKPTDIDEDEARRQQTGAGDQNWQKKFPAMYGDVAEEKEKTSTRRKDPDI